MKTSFLDKVVGSSLEERVDIRGVSTCTAQILSRTKGSGARVSGELLGVEKDARKHHISLFLKQVLRADSALEHLRHELASR